MKKLFCFFSFVLLANSFACQVGTDSVTVEYYKKIIRVLAADSLHGRPASSVYEKKTAGFIANCFKQIKGLNPKFQFFSYKPKDSLRNCKSLNVFCFLDNGKDSTIIIGAHYDHIGMGGPLSKSILKKGVHHGADDNASGVALLLSLAKDHEQWINKRYNYIFVAYSAHEIGLFGSAAFYTYTKKKFGKIALVINFDMVGRMHPDLNWLKVTGAGTTLCAKIFFENPALSLVKFRTEPDTLLKQLDTKKFFENGISSLSFSTGTHDDYHKLSDTEEKINYTGILKVQKTLEEFLKQYGPCGTKKK